MSDTRLSATRTIDASTTIIFELLSNPRRHAQLDGSGMVRSDEKSDRITGTGQVFRMNMHKDDIGDYQTDNHVTGYDQNALLAWQTAIVDKDPAGWEWVWRLDAVDSDTTEVTVSYDWSNVDDPAILKRLTFPVVSKEALEHSLENLAAAVA